MRGHDQSNRRVQSRAWFGLILVATAAVALRPGPGQEVDGAEPPPVVSRARDPIDLAARRVQVWEQGGDQWVLLSGQAAVLQGAEGLRGEEAVVRVSETPSASGGGPSFRLEVYAEGVGSVGRSDPGSAVQTTFTTVAEVRLRPYQPRGLVRLDAPPQGLKILTRSGLSAARKPARDPLLVPTSLTGPTVPSDRAPARLPGSPPDLKSVGTPVVVLPDLEPAPARAAAPGTTGSEIDTPRAAPPVGAEGPAKADPPVAPAQFQEPSDDPVGGREGDLPPPAEATPLNTVPTVPALPSAGPPGGTTTELAPLPAPGTENVEVPPLNGPRTGPRAAKPAVIPNAPILPGTQRITRIYPRNGGPNFNASGLGIIDGRDTVVIRGGVHIITEEPKFGTIDISADSVIIWRKVDPNQKGKGKGIRYGPGGEEIEDAKQPIEFYLEGNVVVLQDEHKVAGNGDQRAYRAKAAYFDLLSDRFIGLDAELNMFAPGLVAPARVTAPRIEQFRPLERAANGKWGYGLQQIRADQTVSTGSRFPKPGYRFNSKSMDITRIQTDQTNPNSGRPVGDRNDPRAPQDLTWRIDARQNVFYMGGLPVFYWPRIQADAENLEPPLRMFTFRTNNYFGQQALSDFNGFRVFGIRKPKAIDLWNIDVDYLSARNKFWLPAVGSEIGWFGNDLFNDLSDPYGKLKGRAPSITKDYFGYFDVWGLRDYGRDILGSGPAVITNNNAQANAGFQRGGGGRLGAVPPFQDFRGRLTFRHMQRFLPDDDEHQYEDLRAQLEVGYSTDRYFIEEYYKRLFDVGLDQETLAYMIRQKDNWAYSIWAEANPYPWQTETQWLPRLDYYRLGDSLVSNRFTYFQHTGVDYASTHTANETNNPHIFAFLPYDPISNTSGTLNAGRAYTNHEVDLPLNFQNILRVVPYVQGQAVGWSNQINGQSVGRIWGAAGLRAEVMAWKAYPRVDSELFNVHGLNHKINLEGDFRDAFSNLRLNQVGVQDDLDDNTYETVRRYFALTNYAGGVLPGQFDPRHLILRRAISPITGPTDVQASLETLHVGLHQRLQTKRGPEGRRRIIDYMTFDLDTTYFPNSARDNFNKPFGQNMYNWQWFLGDRTSIISNGWFEFWNLTAQPIYKTNISKHNDPFGLNVITSGISLNRPPRGSVFLGYTVVNSGPINTSAPIASVNYWMSPKWYGTTSGMYDFGNMILLSASLSLTRIGADYLTSVGLNVDPQRQSYMFAVQISPRLSPNVRFGSGVGLNNFDSRYAPTQ